MIILQESADVKTKCKFGRSHLSPNLVCKQRRLRGGCKATVPTSLGLLSQKNEDLMIWHHLDKGKFKKNVTVQFFYPHVLNMEYFYLNLSLKGVF